MTFKWNVILPGAVWLYSLATTLHLAWLYQRKSFGWALYDFLSHKQASHTHNRECLDRGHGMTFFKSYQWMSDTNKRYDIHKVISIQVRIKYTVWLLIRKSYRLIKPCNTHQYDIWKSFWECLLNWHGMTLSENVIPSPICIKTIDLIE